MQGISSQISSLLGFKQEITNYCHNLAEKIETKASHDEVDKVLKKCKVLIDEKVSKDEMKAKFTEIEKTIKVTEDKLSVRINDLEKKFGDLEINTLWKLKDCEELLKVRVNEKFVWDAINSVEGRIKKDIFNESQGRIERLENQITTLEREMARNADENLRKEKEIKHKLQEINQEFSTKTGKHDHNQLVEVVKNLNLELEGLRHKQLGELEDKIKNIEKMMEKLKGDQYGLMIEELGIKLQKLEEKLIELRNRPIHQETIPVEKDDKNMYQRLLSEIEQLKYQLSQKIDKDMLAELHSSINKPSHPIQPIQDINEL